MHILHFETDTEDRELLQDASNGTDISGHTTAFTPNIFSVDAAKDAEIISVFVGSKITNADIDALPKLQYIITRSAGFDHIDIAYAQTKHITVCNVPSYGSRTVAEYTFALLLGIARKTFEAYTQIKSHNTFSYKGMEGFTLQGKTLGVVGTGKIGQEAIKIAKGFDMHIIAFDAYPNPEAARTLGFTYADLPTLLATSDIITIHVPYNPGTHHLLNSENIQNIKQGAVLINTARGEVVETKALLAALDTGTLRAAGLDVLENEYLLKNQTTLSLSEADRAAIQLTMRLVQHPRVVTTPHMAFYTREAKQEIARITIQSMSAFLSGTPLNIIHI